jgi:hypothetical protein
LLAGDGEGEATVAAAMKRLFFRIDYIFGRFFVRILSFMG